MDKPILEELTPAMCRENVLRNNWPEYCEFLDKNGQDLSIKEKIYLDLNGLKEPKTCPNCGNKLKFINLRQGYQKYCSAKCSNSSPDKIKLTKQRNLEKFGVEVPIQNKEIQNKMKNTCLERYGVENVMCNKEISKKAHNIYKEKYNGIGNGSDIIKDKMKKTMLERYGVENAMHLEEFRNLVSETLLKRYGGKSTFECPQIKEKINNTMIERYGGVSSMQNKNLKEKIKNTMIERYGVPWFVQTKEYKSSIKNDSKPNREFASLLDKNGIEYEREFVIENRRYDFKVNNILIEINPTATHNSTWNILGKDPLKKNYHAEKSKLAENNNYHCIHVWDWDNKDKIIKFLLPRKKIYGRYCKIEEIDKKTAAEFLNEYHFQGNCKGISSSIALIYKDEIVGLMCFGKPRYNKNYEIELLRLCYKDKVSVIGGSKKMLDYYIKKYSPKSIISYCDTSKFTGDVYKSLGVSLKYSGQPSLNWYNGKLHIRDSMLKSLGFDKIFKTSYGKGTSNHELMELYQFVKIYDSGQDTYILELK